MRDDVVPQSWVRKYVAQGSGYFVLRVGNVGTGSASDWTTDPVAQRDQRRLVMEKLVGIKQIVCGSVFLGALAVVVIAQSAFATPITGVQSTSPAVGTFDEGL